jgi:hypothetical protein
MEKKQLKECRLDDEGNLGVYAIGLVSEPAIEAEWVYLSDVKLSAVDGERRMLYGPALIPDKKILRVDEKTGEEYYIYFTKETIYNCAHLFLKKHLQDAHSIEHQTPIEGCTVVESWLIEDSQKDKAAHFGLNFPAGTWMLGTHVREDNVWEAVKAGEITGFSIEGRFDHIKLSKQAGDPIAEFFSDLEKILGEIGKK